MKVTLIFVSTLDGKVTKCGDPHVSDWSSQKDQQYYHQIMERCPVNYYGQQHI